MVSAAVGGGYIAYIAYIAYIDSATVGGGGHIYIFSTAVGGGGHIV